MATAAAAGSAASTAPAVAPARTSRGSTRGPSHGFGVGSSCGRCYRGKTSCDGQRPCDRCTRMGKQDQCADRNTTNVKSQANNNTQGKTQAHAQQQQMQQMPMQQQHLQPPYPMSAPYHPGWSMNGGNVGVGVGGVGAPLGPSLDSSVDPILQSPQMSAPALIPSSASVAASESHFPAALTPNPTRWLQMQDPQAAQYDPTQQWQQQPMSRIPLARDSSGNGAGVGGGVGGGPGWSSGLSVSDDPDRVGISQLLPQNFFSAAYSQTFANVPTPRLNDMSPQQQQQQSSVWNTANQAAAAAAGAGGSSVMQDERVGPPADPLHAEPVQALGAAVAAAHSHMGSVRLFRRQLERREVEARKLKYYFSIMSEVLSAEDFQHFTRELQISIPLSCRAPYSLLESSVGLTSRDLLFVDYTWAHAPTAAMSDEFSTHLASPLALLRLERLSPFLEEPSQFVARKRRAAEARRGAGATLLAAPEAAAEQPRKRKKRSQSGRVAPTVGGQRTESGDAPALATTISPAAGAGATVSPGAFAPSAGSDSLSPSSTPAGAAAGAAASGATSDSDTDAPDEEGAVHVPGCSGPLTFPKPSKYHRADCKYKHNSEHNLSSDLTGAASADSSSSEATSCNCPPMQPVSMGLHINAEMERLIGFTQEELRAFAIKEGSRVFNKSTHTHTSTDRQATTRTAPRLAPSLSWCADPSCWVAFLFVSVCRFSRLDSVQESLRARAAGFLDARSDYTYMHVIRNKVKYIATHARRGTEGAHTNALRSSLTFALSVVSYVQWGAEIYCLARVHITYDDSSTLLDSVHTFTPMPDAKPPPFNPRTK